jgi:hypothetical protein
MRGLEYLDENDGIRGGKKKAVVKPSVKKSDHKHKYVVIRETTMEFSRNIVIVTSECSVCNRKRTDTKFV